MSAEETRRVHQAANKPGLQERMALAMKGRHPATQQIMRWFDYGHLPMGKQRTVSAVCASVAIELAETLGDGPELTAGLRKVLESKDCFVRQAIVDEEKS